MKNYLKHISMVLFAGLTFTACETTDLDLRVSPNDLAADQADPNLLLNSIQLAYASNMDVMSDLGAELTRIDYMFGRDYFNNYPGDTFNAVWSRTYSSGTNDPGTGVQVGMFTNINTLEAIDAESDTDYSFHLGVSKTLQAHMLMLLVDYLGETALSQASNPDEFPAPTLDDGATVYAEALSLLNEAQGLLSGGPLTLGATDFFYGGDTSKWLKLVNTLRLKAYVTTGDTANFNTVIAGGNFISSADDDFEFQYGSSELQPDTRHPDYAADYTPSGANIYQSNWLMELMLNNDDPRIRYYFYRQTDATPGADAPANEETLACSLAVPPQHYQDGGFTYCSVPNGYWGRSHGNDEGTPPDNFFRTAVGVYPAAGRFDDSSFGTVGLGRGGAGAGIEPIILSSYVDFWRADMAANDATRAQFLRSGLEKSIAKVQSFGSLDANADLSVAPTEAEVDAYIDGIVADFNAATGDDKENIFAEQYFVTLYGGATEAYNYYRKTGYPTTVLPNWELDPGAFPRSFLYPQNEVVTNPSLTQKQTLTQQVFWDTNPASPTFPPAN
ncbi:MAG: SusD/RagB family nutrient-binding outer membrane lipoprotein [Muricauda sp.]|uniref:SusD/RagB family nutrient-binding outer membrane lipoprotein n=2 Tax=unclassified Flagellimonas TaxID=2644544 RepID=A0AAU7MX92_9FLAO|nr:SusD/RagB family nutrient-binding outer membrane lipoprotein [Allomuricauda sp.]MBO6830228.1 SusD/RagB family nutrient-binding outer membrane lipoprotein [Allomuricauda sp.]